MRGDPPKNRLKKEKPPPPLGWRGGGAGACQNKGNHCETTKDF